MQRAHLEISQNYTLPEPSECRQTVLGDYNRDPDIKALKEGVY